MQSRIPSSPCEGQLLRVVHLPRSALIYPRLYIAACRFYCFWVCFAFAFDTMCPGVCQPLQLAAPSASSTRGVHPPRRTRQLPTTTSVAASRNMAWRPRRHAVRRFRGSAGCSPDFPDSVLAPDSTPCGRTQQSLERLVQGLHARLHKRGLGHHLPAADSSLSSPPRSICTPRRSVAGRPQHFTCPLRDDPLPLFCNLQRLPREGTPVPSRANHWLCLFL
mmetsp:Transcript_42855/g.132409  ORF Transcript_42855/g.132409 Transcript_42855/m.132409 type:complete len:220 (+) Transcript_42855:2480-3139(+)